MRGRDFYLDYFKILIVELLIYDVTLLIPNEREKSLNVQIPVLCSCTMMPTAKLPMQPAGRVCWAFF